MTDTRSRSPAIRLAISIVALALGLYFVAIVGHVLLVAFGGVLFAILIVNGANLINTWTGLSRYWSLSLLLLVIVAALTLACYLLAPAVVGQVQEFMTDLPKYIDSFKSLIERQPGGAAIVSHLSHFGGGAVSKIASISGMTLLSAIVDIGIVLFVGIYLAIQPELYTGGFVMLFPQAKRARAREVLAEAGTTLVWWLAGRLASMAIVGVLVWLGLLTLGVPLPLVLGLWSGLITFLPNIGPILSTIPTAIVALQAGGPSLLLYAVLLHFGVQIIESYAVTPMIQRYAIAMPPAITLTAQALLGTVFGVTGLALATPLVALSIVLIRQLYVGDYLGDASAKHGIAAGEPQNQ